MNRIFALSDAAGIGGKFAALGAWLDTREGVRWALSGWIAVSLIEYVILGPSSFIWMDDEGELLVTHYNFLRSFHPGGQYSHLIQSGADAYGSFFYGSAYFSFDRMLLATFPTWIGIALHKACVFALGAWGTYILCRRGGGCSRIASLAFGALFTVAFYRLQIVTYGTGLSLSLLPLGMYLCVVRCGRRRYAAGVLAYAVVFATLGSFHGIPPFATALAVAMVVFAKASPRIAVAGVVVVSVFFLNNAESFAALIALSPTSARGAATYGLSEPFVSRFIVGIDSGLRQTVFAAPVMAAAMLLAAAVSIARGKWSRSMRLAGAFVIPPLAIALFMALPWEAVGLAPVRSTPVGYAVFGLLPAAMLGGAWGVDDLRMAIARRWPGLRDFRFAPSLAVFLLGGIVLFEYKAHNFQAWLTTAGQSMYATVDNLNSRSWMPSEPYRAISIRHKQMQPEQNIFMSFYGIPMFDAWTNLIPIEHAHFWRYGIHKGKASWGTDLGLDWRFLDDAHRFHYRLGEQASLALLRLANVRFVFSPVPLLGPGLLRIDGPPHPPLDKGLMKVTGASADYKGRSWRLTLDRWRWQAGRVLHYGKVYTYEIEGALPRAYAARDVAVVSDEMDWVSFFAEVEKVGPQRTIVVRQKDAHAIAMKTAAAEVKSTRLVEDGFDIEVDAANGGIVVVNATWQPFFEATADGVPVPAVSVNGIQTAVPVPPGGRSVKIRYSRPTAGEKAIGLMCGGAGRLLAAVCP